MERFNAVAGWYEPWEYVVSSWVELLDVVGFISHQQRRVYWRGQDVATWALTTSLHRYFLKGRINDDPVVESDLAMRELMLLASARMEWRLSIQDPALIFLSMQHEGAPTRLLDVSLNAFVGVWFALSNDAWIEEDGRVFAFATDPNLYPRPKVLTEGVKWPFDRHYSDSRRSVDDVNSFLVWEPDYDSDPRVPGQHAAFIFGLTPEPGDYLSAAYPKSPRALKEMWSPEEVARSTSIHCGFTEAGVELTTNGADHSAYVIRIKASAKHEIRENLEKLMNINSATIYPGVTGLARRMREQSAWPEFFGRYKDFD